MDSNSDSNCRDSSVERLPLVSITILTSKYVTVIRLASTVSTESIIIHTSKYVTVIRLASTVSIHYYSHQEICNCDPFVQGN